MKLIRDALIAAATCLSASAFAQTPAEARQFLDKALVHVKTVGLQKAAGDFNTDLDRWMVGPLFVVMIGFDGTSLANSSNPRTSGRNIMEMKDADGKQFVRESISRTSKSDDVISVEFKWVNPASKQLEQRVALVRRVPGESAYVGSGYFKH